MARQLAPLEPSPLKNETTGQYIYQGPNRVTRAKVHRLLKVRGVQHRHDASLEELLSICEMHNVPLQAVPPGPIEGTLGGAPAPSDPVVPKPAPPPEPAAPTVVFAEDGYPKNHGLLKKMAKEWGIKTYNTDKRADIVKRLNRRKREMGNG